MRGILGHRTEFCGTDRRVVCRVRKENSPGRAEPIMELQEKKRNKSVPHVGAFCPRIEEKEKWVVGELFGRIDNLPCLWLCAKLVAKRRSMGHCNVADVDIERGFCVFSTYPNLSP